MGGGDLSVIKTVAIDRVLTLSKHHAGGFLCIISFNAQNKSLSHFIGR